EYFMVKSSQLFPASGYYIGVRESSVQGHLLILSPLSSQTAAYTKRRNASSNISFRSIDNSLDRKHTVHVAENHG
ncbi:MAG: hypothetical protein RBS57_14705, partial [Desulforhabdus sp.]|nr:hypothetical protein [Desulforhabdus sp.]